MTAARGRPSNIDSGRCGLGATGQQPATAGGCTAYVILHPVFVLSPLPGRLGCSSYGSVVVVIADSLEITDFTVR